MRHITGHEPTTTMPGRPERGARLCLVIGVGWALIVVLVISMTAVTAAQAGKRHGNRASAGKRHHHRHHHRRPCKPAKHKRHRAHLKARCSRSAKRRPHRTAPRGPAATVPATPPATSTPPTTPPTTPAAAPGPLMHETFDGPDGPFVTSAAFWGSSNLGAAENASWFAESGTMSRRSGTGHVADGTFRMWTRRRDLQDVRVEANLRVASLPDLRGSTASWDGVKFWLRRQLCTPEPACGRVSDPGAQAGYTAEVGLRDGRVYIQKKVGSTYSLLSATPSDPIPYGSWMRVGGVVRNNPDGSVTIQVLRNGQVLVQVTDTGTGGAPLRNPGRIGMRADNADFSLDDLTVTPVG